MGIQNFWSESVTSAATNRSMLEQIFPFIYKWLGTGTGLSLLRRCRRCHRSRECFILGFRSGQIIARPAGIFQKILTNFSFWPHTQNNWAKGHFVACQNSGDQGHHQVWISAGQVACVSAKEARVALNRTLTTISHIQGRLSYPCYYVPSSNAVYNIGPHTTTAIWIAYRRSRV